MADSYVAGSAISQRATHKPACHAHLTSNHPIGPAGRAARCNSGGSMTHATSGISGGTVSDPHLLWRTP
jgi:hypothetical protein